MSESQLPKDIDMQLLLKLLDALIKEQDIKETV
jgi:hypothetical protein